MSDNEDLLADDLGDHSLADYNLGNEEEDQLLADDYESGPQNVPISIDPNYNDGSDISSSEFSGHVMPYSQQPLPYQPPVEECVVPNIIVEVPNAPVQDHSTYAPYEPPVYEPEHAVPPAIPAAPIESPQIVPSELNAAVPNGDNRERFLSERPPGAQRTPQLRDIPDSLDKVFVPRGGYGGRGRTSWRSAQFQARFQQPFNHPYRRHNVHRGNFLQQRPSFPPPQVRPTPPQMRLEQIRPDIRPDQIRLQVRHDPIRPDIRPDGRPERRPEMRPEPMPPMGPEISPERPMIQEPFRPMEHRPHFQNFQRFQFRPNMEEPRPNFGPMRPNFEPRFFQRPAFNPRPFGPPVREVVPNSNHMPQITIRQPLPGMPLPANVPKLDEFGPKPPGREPEVRMLPVQLPPTLPGALAGKKVLINPHFKGNFQPPVEATMRAGLVLPTYIPTRIQKTPPLSPTLENKFGPIKNIDDAAERFIVEQRNALARAASRKFPRRSPQRYIENTTIEIENELAPEASAWRGDEDLLRRQEEFINANRQGLRRRMRSLSPPPVRRSPSPRRSPERRRPERAEPRRQPDEESEYRRRVREQESMRERVLRAKEVRRRKNAVLLHKQLQDKERERNEPKEPKPDPKPDPKPASPDKPTTTSPQLDKPDTTRSSPEREKTEAVKRDRSPVKEEAAEVNSTCENLTPPPAPPSPERALTPPLPDKSGERRYSEDDDLAFILGDIDDMLSDEEDSGRFKEKPAKVEAAPAKPAADLRAKLPPRAAAPPRQRQKIVFGDDKPQKKRREKSPPAKKPAVTSSTKIVTETPQKKAAKPKQVTDSSSNRSRPRIIFENKVPQKEKDDDKSKSLPARRVVLQRKITQTNEKSVFSRIEVNDPTKPNPGIFSRAVRTAIGSDKPRIVIKRDEPEVEYESGSEDEERLLSEDTGLVASVTNLPHGITDTRLKTLAGSEVQSLIVDKEERSALITFRSTVAAGAFRRKFHAKMVAASRLAVVLL